MEIKTVVMPRGIGTNVFDKQVNDAIKEGFKLTRREVVQSSLYAELVKLDDQPQMDDTLTVFDHLAAIEVFCRNTPNCKGCVLKEFCATHLASNEGPADWDTYEARETSRR